MADYIERDAAIRAILDKEDREIKNDYEFCLGLIVASNAVGDLPAADVAPVRHGRWKIYSAKDCLYSCSECHCLPRDKTPYCPSCGAKMDGGENT